MYGCVCILTGVHWSNSSLLVESIENELVVVGSVLREGLSFLRILLKFLLYSQQPRYKIIVL